MNVNSLSNTSEIEYNLRVSLVMKPLTNTAALQLIHFFSLQMDESPPLGQI